LKNFNWNYLDVSNKIDCSYRNFSFHT